MLTKIIKFLLFPSRFLQHQNAFLLTIELAIKSGIASFIYFISQLVLFPTQWPTPSIIQLNRRRQELATDKLFISNKNLKLVEIIAEHAMTYFNQNINNHLKDNPLSYTITLNSCLTDEDLHMIKLIANDKCILDHAERWLGSTCHLRHFLIYANYPNENRIDDEGSKLWHRDLEVYAAAEYYINLTDCREQNGPLFIFKDPNSNRLFQPHFPESLKNLDPWRRYRWYDSDLKRFSAANFPSYVEDNTGKIGKVTFLDSGIHMHKGGATKNGKRIVLRLIYEQGNNSEVPKNFTFSKTRRNNILTLISNNLVKLKTFG